MAKIPVRIESWEYDDETFVLTAVFADLALVDNLDPASFKSTVRIVADIPLPVAALMMPPNVPRRRL